MATTTAHSSHSPAAGGAVGERLVAARWSVAIGVLILFAKVTAWVWTGSVAVMSDALESIVHVGATLVMYAALRWSLAPPDRSHPYGHGKAGAFSVGFEGGLVAAAGALVVGKVVHDAIFGVELAHLGWGMGFTTAAAAVNLILGCYLMRVARRTGSSVLRADAAHVLSDVWTSAAAVIGLALVWVTDLAWIDLVVGGLAGLHLLAVGAGLVREAGRDLMDHADLDELRRVVAVIAARREPEWYDVHRLRMHRVGERRYLEFHLVVPGSWTVAHAHEVVDELERAILSELAAEGAVTIHLDHPAVSATPPPAAAISLASAIRTRAEDPPVPDIDDAAFGREP